MSRPVVALWNAAAGSVGEAAQVHAELARRIDVELLEPASAEENLQLARRAADGGAELVIAAGGDGTVQSTLQGLEGRLEHVRLGILPVGTANDLCRSLGVPLDPREALAVIDEGDARRVDVVHYEVGGKSGLFANVAAGGNGARIGRELEDEVKRRWGPYCYIRGALDMLADLQGYRVALQLDSGAEESVDALVVVVANGRTSAGGLEVAPRARLDDGLLDVVLVRDGPPVDVAAVMARFMVSDYLESEHVVFRRAARVRVDGRPPLPFTIDGNPLPEGPTEFTVMPGALRVHVGPTFDALAVESGARAG